MLSIKWKDHAILRGPDTVIYIDYDEMEAIAAVIITPAFLDIICRSLGPSIGQGEKQRGRRKCRQRKQSRQGIGKRKDQPLDQKQTIYIARFSMGTSPCQEKGSRYDKILATEKENRRRGGDREDVKLTNQNCPQGPSLYTIRYSTPK